MIRKKLSEVPVEKGESWAVWILWGYAWFVIGWVMHPECAMWFA